MSARRLPVVVVVLVVMVVSVVDWVLVLAPVPMLEEIFLLRSLEEAVATSTWRPSSRSRVFC